MTQPPYVPPRDNEGSASSTPTWPASPETPSYDYTSTTGEPAYDEPVSSVAVGGYSSGGQSTADVAKDQAAGVKDTAVEQGQQVAGVAKDQAGVVKDTAVEQGQHVAGVAKEQAGAVKDTAVGEAQHVAEVAKDQVQKVAGEASVQLRDLLSEGLSEVRSAASSQQRRLAGGVHSLADELGTMASKSEGGPLTNYAHEASRRGGELAHWLENAEPSEVLDYLRSYARRRPAVFLGASALAGALVGRLTRGFVANARDTSPASSTTPGYSSPDYTSGTGYSSGTTSGTGYSSGTDYATGPDYSASTPGYASPSAYDTGSAYESTTYETSTTTGTGIGGTGNGGGVAR